MGLDADHMGYAAMTQAIPPAFSQLIFAQACMRELEHVYGVTPILFDEVEENPDECRRRMWHLRRGAGGDSPDQGVEFEAGPSSEAVAAVERSRAARPAPDMWGCSEPQATSANQPGRLNSQKCAESSGVNHRRQLSPNAQVGLGTTFRELSCAPDQKSGAAVETDGSAWEAAKLPLYRPRHSDATGDKVAEATDDRVRAVELREVWYSWAGGFDQAWADAADLQELSEVGGVTAVTAKVDAGSLRGHHSFVSVGKRRSVVVLAEAAAAVESSAGTRVVVELCSVEGEQEARRLGFALVRRVKQGKPRYAAAGEEARTGRRCSFWSIGEEVEAGGQEVPYLNLEAAMDPLDRTGAAVEPKTAKAARSYVPIEVERERWNIGLSAELDKMMHQGGAVIEVWHEPGFAEVPFYPFATDEGLLRAIAEADRAIAAGAMEYVPARCVDAVRSESVVHPWTIVDQGGGSGDCATTTQSAPTGWSQRRRFRCLAFGTW